MACQIHDVGLYATYLLSTLEKVQRMHVMLPLSINNIGSANHMQFSSMRTGKANVDKLAFGRKRPISLL